MQELTSDEIDSVSGGSPLVIGAVVVVVVIVAIVALGVAAGYKDEGKKKV